MKRCKQHVVGWSKILSWMSYITMGFQYNILAVMVKISDRFTLLLPWLPPKPYPPMIATQTISSHDCHPNHILPWLPPKPYSPIECPCGTGPQTTNHILQSCPTFDDLRRQTWPSLVEAHRKLWGHCGRLRTLPYSPDWQSSMARNAEYSPMIATQTIFSHDCHPKHLWNQAIKLHKPRKNFCARFLHIRKSISLFFLHNCCDSQCKKLLKQLQTM